MAAEKTNSQIEQHNPFDYMRHLEHIPQEWVDFYDSTPRTIRCVSDGSVERLYTQNNPKTIDAMDIDDLLYYLDAALSDERLWHREDEDDETGEPVTKNPANVAGQPVFLEEGREYTLKKAGIDYDSDLGMVWIEEIDNDYGFPAILFEELTPVTPEQRRRSYGQWVASL